MKSILTLAVLMYSLSSFSQSFLILNNGVTLTTDKEGFVYDLHNFILPYDVSFKGAQFLAEKSKLITLDEKGFVYRKEDSVGKVRGTGANYFIDKNSNLVTVDTKGFHYWYEKNDIFKKATAFGGKFFISSNQLFTVNENGNYFQKDIKGLNPANITTMGGNYFLTKEKVLYTVSKEGFVFSKDLKVNSLVKLGGNYFLADNNFLYTVSEDGFLIVPVLPANLKVDSISKLGSNYFLDQDGKLFVVDSKGNMFEREVKDHDLRNSKVLSF